MSFFVLSNCDAFFADIEINNFMAVDFSII